ncbi:MAG: hypothetical protein MZV63_47660 [Marinilabiliales bacterium]|nr:hypothetical protein [Marinilabiliales bacterium]
MIFTAPDGILHTPSYFDGTVKKTPISTFSAGHRTDFSDLDGDGKHRLSLSRPRHAPDL